MITPAAFEYPAGRFVDLTLTTIKELGIREV